LYAFKQPFIRKGSSAFPSVFLYLQTDDICDIATPGKPDAFIYTTYQAHQKLILNFLDAKRNMDIRPLAVWWSEASREYFFCMLTTLPEDIL
jgi:hypothetical protein